MAVVEKDLIEEALREVYDPEVGINIIDLGLVYGIEVDENGLVDITMTLTTPACPLGPTIEQKRPTFDTLPSFMNGNRQTALSRVIATNKTVSLGSSTSPLGLMPVSSRRSRLPLVESRYTRPVGSCNPVYPWSVK